MSHEAIQKRPFKSEAARLASAYRQAKSVIKRQDILFALGLVALAADGAVDSSSTRLLGFARGIEGMQYTPRKNEDEDPSNPEPDLESIAGLLADIAMLWADYPDAISVISAPNSEGSHRFELYVHPKDAFKFLNDKDENSFMWIATELINRITMRLFPQIENVVIDLFQTDVDGSDQGDETDSESKASRFKQLLKTS